jgi:hypothetical protein
MRRTRTSANPTVIVLQAAQGQRFTVTVIVERVANKENDRHSKGIERLWSPAGQPVAITGKSLGGRSHRNKPNSLPRVGTACRGRQW